MRVTDSISIDDSELDEDWSDEDLEEPLDLFGGQNGELAADGAITADGAATEVDLLEEAPPQTAEEATEVEVSGNGAEQQAEAPEEEPL